MSNDPHTGGRLEDMAEHGTSIPGDAGLQRTIKSVPRPDQINPNPSYAHPSLASGADNAYDIPRGLRDQGATGNVVTGTGDPLTSNVEKKRLDDVPLHPGAHGHDRVMKSSKGPNLFRSGGGAAEMGHDVAAAPGEEDLGQEDLLDRRGAK